MKSQPYTLARAKAQQCASRLGNSRRCGQFDLLVDGRCFTDWQGGDLGSPLLGMTEEKRWLRNKVLAPTFLSCSAMYHAPQKIAFVSFEVRLHISPAYLINNAISPSPPFARACIFPCSIAHSL
ncbi:hypothetical protein [Rubritalea tangerina]|uniref:hypothetical protein n=1 Tax=Rubritalea tangerina TaxID=430798 RepID=UPI003617C9D8